MGKKMGASTHEHGDGSGASHGDRPWVFFMVDCFFLITEFFVLTFQFKVEESVLPQRLPPGGTAAPAKVISRDAKEPLRVHVTSGGGIGNAAYQIMGDAKVALPELTGKLASLAGASPNRYTVRVSYDPDAPWGDVMSVFNACNKVKIEECGLVPCRTADVPTR